MSDAAMMQDVCCIHAAISCTIMYFTVHVQLTHLHYGAVVIHTQYQLPLLNCVLTDVYTHISNHVKVCAYLIDQWRRLTLTHVLNAMNIHASDCASRKYCCDSVVCSKQIKQQKEELYCQCRQPGAAST
eukprot:18661-Heterococcus_DN1.PRE.3